VVAERARLSRARRSTPPPVEIAHWLGRGELDPGLANLDLAREVEAGVGVL
jgi:hypothetical protein